MNGKSEELKIVDIQLWISVIMAGVIIVSTCIGYNTHLKLSGKKPFWSDELVKKIVVISKLIILIAGLILFYLAYVNLNYAKNEDKDIESPYLTLFAAFFFLVAAFLFLIVAIKDGSEDLQGFEL